MEEKEGKERASKREGGRKEGGGSGKREGMTADFHEVGRKEGEKREEERRKT